MGTAPAEATAARQPDPAKQANRLRAQAAGCGFLGSRLYEHILTRAADDVDARGPVWDVIEPYALDPGGSMLALRLMGATHRLALTGDAPALAARYPSTGGDGDVGGAWDAWYALVRDRAGEVGPLVANGVQTNEVGRCAILLGGFLEVARATGLPLRLLEIGTSAALNLRWDRYRYHAGDQAWGPADAAVDLGDPFALGGVGAPPLEPRSVVVTERAGCDVNPIDPTSREGRVSLLSFVWPDQTVRFGWLRAACDMASSTAVDVAQDNAGEWLRRRLAVPAPGAATVAFHSVMMQYVEASERAGLVDTIAAAGARATTAAPVAWLRFEPAGHLADDMELRLTTWPGGDERRLAIAHPHGMWVRWLAPTDPPVA